MSATALYITLSNIPFWVWPLLFVLILVGTTASKDRTVSNRLFWFLPLIGFMAVPTLIRIGSIETAAIFLLAYGTGTVAGSIFQRSVFLGVENNRTHLRGEWMTMVVVMILFSANFAFGTVNAVSPELAQDYRLLVPFVVIIGLCSGSFLGRSLFVISRFRAMNAIV